MTQVARECEVCHRSFTARRDARTCSARCRQRRKRGIGEVTAADRELMDRIALLVPIPVPALTEEEVRAHVLGTVQRGR